MRTLPAVLPDQTGIGATPLLMAAAEEADGLT
jgi:hypothetical protein